MNRVFFYAINALGAIALMFSARANAQETLFTSDNAYNPVPSPDGKYIAYVRTGWGERFSGFGRGSLVSDVKLINASGAGLPKTLAEDFFVSGWTPDSRRVICFRDGRYALVSVHGRTDAEGSIPNIQGLHAFSEWVSYLSATDSVIWSRVEDQGHSSIEGPFVSIVDYANSRLQRVIASSNGRYLALYNESGETELRVYDLGSKRWTDFGKITIHPDTYWAYIQPNWSPWSVDGSRLVFLRGSNVVICMPDGTEKTEIRIDGSAGLPVLSPDGKSVAYVTSEPRPMNDRSDLQFWGDTVIQVVPVLPGARSRAVTEKNLDEVRDLKWLDDHTLVFDRIADAAFYEHARIWKVSFQR